MEHYGSTHNSKEKIYDSKIKLISKEKDNVSTQSSNNFNFGNNNNIHSEPNSKVKFENISNKHFNPQIEINSTLKIIEENDPMEIDDDWLNEIVNQNFNENSDMNINLIYDELLNSQSSLFNDTLIKNVNKPEETIKEYFKVISVQSMTTNEHKTVTKIKCDPSLKNNEEDIFKINLITVVLKGLWAEVMIDEGDFVFISSKYNNQEGCYIIDDYDYKRNMRNSNQKIDDKNLELIEEFIIIEPEILISPTRIKTAFPCYRRSIFNEHFLFIINPNNTHNKELILGSILHEVFESVVKECHNNVNLMVVESYIKNKIKNVCKKFTLDFAIHKYEQEEIEKSASDYINNIIKFFRDFFIHQSNIDGLKIKKYSSVENVFQSQVLGMKGVIDMLVETENENKEDELTPLELKTGFNMSQQDLMQVLVYCLILSEQTSKNFSNGLLLYLKRDTRVRIKAKKNDIVNVIVIRNNIAKYVKKLNSNPNEYQNGLPELYKNKSECNRCYQKDVCHAHYFNHENKTGNNLNEGSIIYNLNIPKEEIDKYKFDHDTSQYFDLFYNIINQEEAFTYSHEKSSIKDGEIRDLSVFKKFKIEKFVNKKNSFDLTLISDEDLDLANQESDGEIVSQFVYLNDGFHIFEPINKKSFYGILVNKSDDTNSSRFTLNILKTYVLKFKKENPIWNDSRVNYIYLKNVNTNAKFPFRLMRGNLMTICLNLKPNLKEILINHREPKMNYDKEGTLYFIRKNFENEFNNLNENQKYAVLKALSSEDYTLVIGFPGSGKTTLIALLIDMLTKMNKKVLVCAHTNVAVDNILLKLIDRGLNFCRVSNHENSVNQAIRRYMLKNQKIEEVGKWKEFIENTMIFGVTTLGVYNKLLANMEFDYCIVDEACQIFEPTLLGPLMISKKFILVGDPFQLPALLKSVERPPVSLFERLWNKYDKVGVELIQQYRMNDEIMKLSNECVYNNIIKCANQIVARRRLDINLEDFTFRSLYPDWIFDLLDPERPVIFADYYKYVMRTCPEFLIETMDKNIIEGDIIKTIISAFKDMNYDLNKIGVITPYNSQESHLSESLRELDFFNVYTIDKSQGIEKEIVIISFVKTNNKSKILRDISRINVAFTRPKTKLIIIGLIDFLSEVEKLGDYMKIIKRHNWVYEFEEIYKQ